MTEKDGSTARNVVTERGRVAKRNGVTEGKGMTKTDEERRGDRESRLGRVVHYRCRNEGSFIHNTQIKFVGRK